MQTMGLDNNVVIIGTNSFANFGNGNLVGAYLNAIDVRFTSSLRAMFLSVPSYLTFRCSRFNKVIL